MRFSSCLVNVLFNMKYLTYHKWSAVSHWPSSDAERSLECEWPDVTHHFASPCLLLYRGLAGRIVMKNMCTCLEYALLHSWYILWDYSIISSGYTQIMTLYEVIEGLIVEFHDIDKVFYVYFYILLFATYVGIQISKTIHLKRSCCAARPHFASLVRFCISLHVIVVGGRL